MISFTLEKDWDYRGAEYADLFANSAATAFQHPIWLHGLYHSLAPHSDAEGLTVAIRERSGELIGVLPLMRIRRRGIRIIEFADLGVTDYCAPVVRNGRLDLLYGHNDLAGEILKTVGSGDLFRVKSVRPEHAKLVESISGATPVPAGFSSHEAHLTAPYADWRENAFSKSHIRYINRRQRRFDKLGDTEFRHLEGADEIRQAIAELREFRSGRFDGDPIQNGDVLDFYTDIAVQGAPDGYARTYRLAQAGNSVGIVFGTAHKGRFNYLLIGCDYDNFSKVSPGLLMYDRIMEDWLENGGETFDFTIGDEPFKADFGTMPVRISSYQKAISIAGRVAGSVHALTRRFA